MQYTISLNYKGKSPSDSFTRRDHAAAYLEKTARRIVRGEANLDTRRGVDFVNEADWLAGCLRDRLSPGVYDSVECSPGFEIRVRVAA